MLITCSLSLSLSLSVSYKTCKLFLAACLSLLLPLNFSVAVNILLCDILTQGFCSFEIDLLELFFFCKVLKFLLPAPFVFFHDLSVLFVSLMCVCAHMFSWGPKTSFSSSSSWE
jgi:hypothetical protein